MFSGTKEIASGGRYDDLLRSLGLKNIPAVGIIINLKYMNDLITIGLPSKES